MEKYTAYKPSGIKWIGDIPGHWELNSIKRVADFNPKRKCELGKDDVIGYAPMDKIKRGFMTPITMRFSEVSSIIIAPAWGQMPERLLTGSSVPSGFLFPVGA